MALNLQKLIQNLSDQFNVKDEENDLGVGATPAPSVPPVQTEPEVQPSTVPNDNPISKAIDTGVQKVVNGLMNLGQPKQPKLTEDEFYADPTLAGPDGKYGSYSNYRTNTVTDAYKSGSSERAREIIADSRGGSFLDRLQALGGAFHEWASTSESERAAKLGMSVSEYGDYQRKELAVKDAKNEAITQYGTVKSAGKALAGIQDEINATYTPNYGMGNIDLSATPRFDNGDGTYSYIPTVQYLDPETGKVLLIPAAKPLADGSWEALDYSGAVARYRRTGAYFGAFNNATEAQQYANELTSQQEELYTRRAELSTQYQANRGVFDELLSGYNSGARQAYLDAVDAFDYDYKPVQYYLSKGQSLSDVDTVIEGLNAIIATSEAGSPSYENALRRRDELVKGRMRFATDEELDEIYNGGSYSADTQKAIDERMDFLRKNNFAGDPMQDTEIKALMQADKDDPTKLAAGQEIERRDAERIAGEVEGTEAGKFVEGLAQYAATGKISDDLIDLFGLSWNKDAAELQPNDAGILSAMGLRVQRELKKQGYSKQEAANVVDALQREGNRLYAEQNRELMQQLTNDTEVGMTALSVLSNMLSGLGEIEGARVLFGNMTNRTADPNSLWFSALDDTNAIRETVMENHDKNVQIGDRTFDLFDLGYGVATSTLDSTMAALFPGRIGGALIGTQAAAQALKEAAEKGVPIGEAVLTSIVAGVNEGLWESVSIGNLKSLKDAPTWTFWDVVKNVGKQGFVNGSEELNTEIANVVFDYLKYANGSSFSDYGRNVAQYMTQINPATGKVYTEKEAKNRVLIDAAVQCIESGATGFIQGVLMGSTAQASSVLRTKAFDKDTKSYMDKHGREIHMLSWAAVAQDKESELYKLGETLSKEFDAIHAVQDEAGQKGAQAAYWERNAENFEKLSKLITEARMDGNLPAMLTQEYLDAQVEAIKKGDETPPHVESPTEMNIRTTLEQTGMSEDSITAVSPLLLHLLNGDPALSTKGVKQDVLKSEAFKNAVTQLTGFTAQGTSFGEIRRSLNTIAKQIRESKTITFATEPTLEPQNDLVQPTEATEPAPATPEEAQQAFMSDVVGRVANGSEPAQMNIGEPIATPTQNTGAPAQNTGAPAGRPRQMIRFAAADETVQAETPEAGPELTAEQVRSMRALNAMGEGSGHTVELVNGDDPIINGQDAAVHNGVTYINADRAKNFGTIAYFAGHEYYHDLESKLGREAALGKVKAIMGTLLERGLLGGRYADIATSDDAWNKLVSEYAPRWVRAETRARLAELKELNTSKSDAELQELAQAYAEAKVLEPSYISGEVAADFFGSLFGYNQRNEAKGLISPNVDRMKLLVTFTSADRSFVENAADSVLRMRDRLDAQGLEGEERDHLSDLLLELGTALYFTDKNETGGRKYRAAELEDMSFADQIDLACTGQIDRKEPMRIGRTGNFLRALGLRDHTQFIQQGKFFLSAFGMEGTQTSPDEGAVNTHAVTYDTMERLPELIENPAMVYRTRHGSGTEIVVVTTDVDKDGYPVVAVIKPDGVANVGGKWRTANFIESVYGAENLVRNYDDPSQTTLQQIVREGLLMWADEEKSRNLLQRYQERFPISATSDKRGGLLDNADPLAGFVFGTIVQRWNPDVKSFDREQGVMEPIRNTETGRVYGSREEFSNDAQSEAENRGLFYDGISMKDGSYIAYALGPDGTPVELYHAEGIEELDYGNRADTEVLRGGKNAETRTYVPGGRDVNVQTSDYKTPNGEKALLIESVKNDNGRDRSSDYALRRTLMRAAQEGYDLLLWADSTAQMNAFNPYMTQNTDGQVEGLQRMTDVYDKGFTKFFSDWGGVEMVYLPDAEQSVAPERYLQLQSERAETMRQLDEMRQQMTQTGAENWADAQLQTRKLQTKLTDINAEMAEIRHDDEKVEQRGATVPGIRITDEVKNRIGEFERRFAAADLGEDGMYSALEREIENLQTNKKGLLDANFVKTLKNRAQKVRGLMDEIRWSELEDAVNQLKSNGVDLTKDRILAFVRGNTPVLEEQLRKGRAFDAGLSGGEMMNPETGEIYPTFDQFTQSSEADAKREGLVLDSITREPELDLRGNEIVNPFTDETLFRQVAWGRDADGNLHRVAEAVTGLALRIRSETEATRWEGYAAQGGEDYTEHVYTLPYASYENAGMEMHWQRPGVLLHVREQTMQTPDGKKVLFLDEIQSDWHNEGSKERYESKGGTVPDAPYEKTYTEYALKQMLLKAAQEGYDYIAWTTPGMQMDRWNPYRLNAQGVEDKENPMYLNGYKSTYGRDLPTAAKRYGEVTAVELEDVHNSDHDTRKFFELNIEAERLRAEIAALENQLVGLAIYDEVNEFDDMPEYDEADMPEYDEVNEFDDMPEYDEADMPEYDEAEFLIDDDDRVVIGYEDEEQANAIKERLAEKQEDLDEIYEQARAERKHQVPGDAITEAPAIEITPELRERILTEGLTRYAAADTEDYQDFVAGKAANDRQTISNEQLNNTQDYRANRQAVNIPQSGTLPGYVTDRNVQTLINAGITPDEAAQTFMSGIANGAYQHMRYSDTAALDKANKEIEHYGWAETLGKYRAEVLAGKASKDISAMGVALYNNAVTNGKIYDAMDIASLMVKNASSVGSALQAFRMLNRSTPDGRYYMAVRSIENIADELRGIYGDDYHFELDSAMLDAYRAALISGDETQQKEIWGAIEQTIADQIPSDWKLKLNNWRYLAMLGNPRTHIRNIVGNLGFAPVRLAKQGLKAVMERLVLGQAGQGSNRTTAILDPLSSEDRARKAAAKADYANVVDLIQSGGKLSSTKGEIENMRTVYDHARFLEWLRKKNSALLDKEDTWFSRPAYAEALASFLKARGIDGDAFAAGNIDPDTLNTAREHAILEAQRATYRDTNAFSAWVSSLGKAGKQKNATGVQKLASGAMEAVLPFKKTPANILVRAVEYSPAGFAMALRDGIKDVRAAQAKVNAAMAQNDGSETAWRNINALQEQADLAVSGMLDHLASGLTGTALFGLGALLRSLGIIAGGKDPDDEQANFDDLHGQQEYSVSTNAIADRINEATGWHINLGNVNYTLDWLAPEALPLFTGVTLYDKIKQMRAGSEDTESDPLTDVWNLIVGMGEPMLNMSMLSSVNDLVSKMSYLDDATQLPALLGQIGYSYISQYIPTLFGQIERVTENRRESTYYDRSDKLSKDLQYMLGKTANKIPVWDYNQIPYLDAWGREQDSGNLLRRVVSNMISPGYIRDINTSELDDELQRLHDLGYEKMIPQRTTQSTKVDQEYMNEEEYVAYARTKGQTALADLTALTESDAYSRMDDDQKAKAIAKIYSDAKIAAEDEVRRLRGEKVEGTKADEAGLDSATFNAAKTIYETATAPSWYEVYNDDGEQKVPNWAKMLNVLEDKSFSKNDRLSFVNAISTKKEKFTSFDEAVEYYTEARDDAQTEIKFADAKDAYDNAKLPNWGALNEKGEIPGWAKMLGVLDSKNVSNSTKLEYINKTSGRNDEFQSLDEARTYYTASGVYNSAKTPEGYKPTDSGNTPGWAKALSVIESDMLDDDEKLWYINAVSGKKEAFKTLTEATAYYTKQKNKAKK